MIALEGDGRPLVVQLYPMLHADGEALLRSSVRLETAPSVDPEVIVEAGREAVALIASGPAHVDSKVLAQLRSLVVLASVGSGVDCFDVAAATRLGIPVVSNAGVAAGPVAEYVIGAIVWLHRRLDAAAGFFTTSWDWTSRPEVTGDDVSGRMLGLVGFGQVARDVARRARAGLDMRIAAFDPVVADQTMDEHGVECMESLDSLLGAADVVSVHVPLDESTRGLLGPRQLGRMRPGAFLINTSRGGVVDEDALLAAVESGRLGGAAVDVLSEEPPRPDLPILQAREHLVVTPHVAGLTADAAAKLSRGVAANVLACLGGERPAGIVNPEAWPPRVVGGDGWPLPSPTA